MMSTQCKAHASPGMSSNSCNVLAVTYRNDHEATLARNAALEAKVAELEAERDARTRPASRPRADPGGEVGHVMTIVFGGIALLALPIIVPIARGTWRPEGAPIAGLAILSLAGPALAATLSRLLRPNVPIWETLESGERLPVERSPKARRLHATIAGAVYAAGAALAIL